MNCNFFIFLFIGIFEGIILSIFRIEIFDYNPELGYYTLAKKVNKNGEIIYFLRDKRQAHKESSTAQKIWIFVTRTVGVMLGWILMWLLIDKRLNYFSQTEIKAEDLALFILALIGINGRLPTVVESVQEWFKR